MIAAFQTLPATSRPTHAVSGGTPGFAVQLYGEETNGPPAGVLTVSAACVQPLVAKSGQSVEAGPDSASATASTYRNDPGASPL